MTEQTFERGKQNLVKIHDLNCCSQVLHMKIDRQMTKPLPAGAKLTVRNIRIRKWYKPDTYSLVLSAPDTFVYTIKGFGVRFV